MKLPDGRFYYHQEGTIPMCGAVRVGTEIPTAAQIAASGEKNPGFKDTVESPYLDDHITR